MGRDNDLPGAITAGDFVSVTLAANDGFALDLESLTFVVSQVQNGAQDYAVFSDVTGFGAADAIAFGDNAIPTGPITTAGALQTIDLSSTVFDNLSSIEFRVVYDDRFADIDDRIYNRSRYFYRQWLSCLSGSGTFCDCSVGIG